MKDFPGATMLLVRSDISAMAQARRASSDYR
jgi:hypothetical protein